jgi:hypothetical protein
MGRFLKKLPVKLFLPFLQRRFFLRKTTVLPRKQLSEYYSNFNFKMFPSPKHLVTFCRRIRVVLTEFFFRGKTVVFLRKNLLCKVNSLFWRANFFPPKFPFPKFKRKIWREKVYYAKERGPFSSCPDLICRKKV